MNSETQRKARFWLALVFLLGAAVGVVFGYSFGRRSFASTKWTAPTMSEAERRAKLVGDITKEVGLTSEQSAKVEEIIRNTHEAMKAIHAKSDADLDAVRQKARGEIRQLLTPEQKAKFEEIIQRMDAARKAQQQK
jgi:Spy/CpxP family protein refolding chaperone